MGEPNITQHIQRSMFPFASPSIKKDDEMLDKNFAPIRNDTVKLCFRGFEKPFFGGAVCLTSKTQKCVKFYAQVPGVLFFNAQRLKVY